VKNSQDVRTGTLFRPVSGQTTALLDELIERKEPIFGMPALFVPVEAAQVGLMLSETLRELSGGAPGETYRAAVIRSPPATMTNSARRFRLQHDSSCSAHNGRSSPFDVSVTRVESTPRSTRYRRA